LPSPYFAFFSFFCISTEQPYILSDEIEIELRENHMFNGIEGKLPRKTIVILGKKIPMPQSIIMRRALGGSLVVGGALGFLPILGFWMLPLGLIVLSNDSHRVRRLRRKSEILILRKWRKTKQPPTAS